MVNITVHQTGEVTGDKGRLIGYEGQSMSETITVVHPIFSGANYYIEYKYNATIFRDVLDSNNRVNIKIEKDGYLTCQFIAVEINTGNILFKSHKWNFIIGSQMDLEPSHYPCSSFMHTTMNHHQCIHDHHHYHDHCNNDKNIDSYNAYYELLNELRNEEDVRFNETQKLNEDVIKIKQILNIDNSIASIIDANEIINSGEYIAGIGSKNLPNEEDLLESTQEYILSVYKRNNIISQQAFESDSNNIWYRTGSMLTDRNIIWSDWTPNITRVNTI